MIQSKILNKSSFLFREFAFVFEINFNFWIQENFMFFLVYFYKIINYLLLVMSWLQYYPDSDLHIYAAEHTLNFYHKNPVNEVFLKRQKVIRFVLLFS